MGGHGNFNPGPIGATFEEKLFQQLISMRDTVPYAIILNLCKACYTLDMERCLDILAGYRVGPRTIRILRMYWARLQVEAKAGGNYGPAFQIHGGITQGDPCYPQSLTWLLTLSSDTG